MRFNGTGPTCETCGMKREAHIYDMGSVPTCPAATNNDCNGTGPHVAGEVRLMPLGKEPMHGNNILCRSCWQRELSYRQDRNRTLGEFARFELPRWEDAKVYGE